MGLGGALHPPTLHGVPFMEHTAFMLANPTWVVSHSWLLIGAVLLLAGLLVGRREPLFREVAGGVLPIAILGTVVWSVENAFHLAAVLDLDELRAGEATPILLAHLGLSVVAYPLGSYAVAVLAMKMAPRWPLLLRPLGWIGALGAVVFGTAAPLVVLTRDQSYSFLFPMGALPLSAWLLAAGLIPLRGSAAAVSESHAGDTRRLAT